MPARMALGRKRRKQATEQLSTLTGSIVEGTAVQFHFQLAGLAAPRVAAKRPNISCCRSSIARLGREGGGGC